VTEHLEQQDLHLIRHMMSSNRCDALHLGIQKLRSSLYSVRCTSPPPSQDAWSENCFVTNEDKATMSRFWSTALLGAALMSPIALAPRVLRAEDQKAARNYHDKQHNDDHAWNGQEDKAYRIYAKQNHRKSSEFSKLKDDDQQNYWSWRHEHSDALLKIEIR
jgi:hypothetical protein